jgi:3-deoxy-D-arabino-heptulosonate 7-phosphate (DAHP) synthase
VLSSFYFLFFKTVTRNALDLSLLRILKRETYLAMVIDPRPGTGQTELVEAMAFAAVAARANSTAVEVHPCSP